MSKQYTVETMRDLLERNDTAVERACVAMYKRQTADEQAVKQTGHKNGVGLNGPDAEIISSFAEQILGIGTFEINGKTYTRKGPKSLSEKQIAIARRKLVKYARQLVEIASGEPSQTEPEVAPAPGPADDDAPEYRAATLEAMRSEAARLLSIIDGLRTDVAVYKNLPALNATFEAECKLIAGLGLRRGKLLQAIADMEAEDAGKTPASNPSAPAPARHDVAPEPPETERYYGPEMPAVHDPETCSDCQTLTGDDLWTHMFGSEPERPQSRAVLTMMDVLNAGPVHSRNQGKRRVAPVATAH